MFSSNQISALKKANISVDIERTKIRISEDFKAASKEAKKEILELSGLTANAYYNTGRTGAASPKAVLALAQVLMVSPHWYTGEADEKESATNAELKAFYKKYSGKKSAGSKSKTARGKRSKKNVSKSEVETVQNPRAEAKPYSRTKTPVQNKFENGIVASASTDSSKMEKAINNLDLESAVILLKALYVRAETGGKAEELCNIVKKCLLS